MGVEVATYIGDLTPTTPGSSDLQNQGDDHLRLLKTVLQNSFPSLGKAIYFPSTTSKSADFSVLAADMNKTFLVTTTSGAVNMTLPSLSSGDAGWECFLMKTSFDVNPVMVKPPSGTLSSGALSGLSAARRCIPSKKVSCFWTGTAFVIGRATEAGPVGSTIEYHGSTLPYGFEWPNSQTLASASTFYPEYNAVMGSGVTLDVRGRNSIPLDNLGGSSAGRLAGGAIAGTTIGNVGGLDTLTIVQSGLPNVAPTFTGTPGTATSTNSNVPANSAISNTFGPGGNGALIGSIVGSLSSSFTPVGVVSSINGNVSQTASKILNPSIMVAKLLVTE